MLDFVELFSNKPTRHRVVFLLCVPALASCMLDNLDFARLQLYLFIQDFNTKLFYTGIQYSLQRDGFYTRSRNSNIQLDVGMLECWK